MSGLTLPSGLRSKQRGGVSDHCDVAVDFGVIYLKNEALIRHFGVRGGGEQRGAPGDGTVLSFTLHGNVN